MKIKDKILSETSEEVKQRVRDTANKLVMKQEIDMSKYTIDIDPYDKQETLEEAAENYANQTTENDEFYKLYVAFKEGAKWQQEQIGKSEFLQRLRGTLSDAEARRLIFETFKKK